jgi:hypothetical protein
MSGEFPELFWVLEAILVIEPVLDKVLTGPCFAAADLPKPTPEERKAPSKAAVAGDQLDMLADEDGAGEDDDCP